RVLRTWIESAFKIVPSVRGTPGHPSVNLLVWWLARVWNEHTTVPFTRTRKGDQQPRDFVVVVCRAADPNIGAANIETAMRAAVKDTPGSRRGRKSTIRRPD